MTDLDFQSPDFFKKLQKRNKEAFRILYETFKVQLYNLVFSMVKDNDKTADIIQDTFIKVIKKIHTLQDHTKLKHWLYRIAVNSAINVLNREKRFSYSENDLEAVTEKIAMEDFHIKKEEDPEEMRYLILELVERLPVKQQAAFNLKYVENLKEVEIGEILDIPVGTVKSRLNIARNRLKQWLQEELANRGY
jgi:RNA polymerase sigma-70 factor (ECF subfamily)